MLLKTIAQTLPNYAMSVFLLPLDLCQQFERLMCRYWWQTDSKKARSIHWQSWSRMSCRKSRGGMGFRNVHNFNLALLGSQGWRLLKYPNKLVSRVFKAKYYPKTSFLNAEIGTNPSYIWRSIMEAKPLICKGVGCRVGNGSSISICSDPWLPDETNPYISTQSAAITEQMVSSLISPDQNDWDTDLVMDIFNSRDSSIILSTPIDKEVDDSWYWRKEKFGQYSVKSAYLMLEEVHPFSANNSGFWRTLWNLKIPPKVKNFLWRASTDCLPSREMLRTRNVQVSPVCAVCNADVESIFHVLVLCPFASICLAKLNCPLPSVIDSNFTEWLTMVFQYQKNMVLKIVMVCWLVWRSRNELIWNKRSIDPNEVVLSASSILDQWSSVQDRSYDQFLGYMTPEDGMERWSKPVGNSIKINSDAAIFAELNSFGCAMVVRDSSGQLVEASVKKFTGKTSVETAEVMGIREALSWVKQMDVHNVTIESDSLSMIQAIRSAFPCFSYLGRLVKECRVLLSSMQQRNIQLRFVKRSANQVAHYLAREFSSIADRIWRMRDVHPQFHSILLQDLRVL